ncbi:hypothetical protein EW026_g7804 [Hermanssonia centrifuga]|uniref:Uncharacterized protein n=2 Tax=Hermanssonia centrifuga TaxID=98765 RepID=A0A4S4K6M0_9APHY|nr:hypothetical protein PHLCEN_2v4422 [Hermanssonia centrifuga]THG93433.1 hypothetical protein EW026_g7804 [Hermanssonia centrifuga]
MKSSFVLAALVASAFAQGIDIGAPVEYSNITPGSNITVEVDRPDTLTGSTPVALVIAIESCTSYPDGQCASVDVTQRLQHILYTGSYDPVFDTPSDSKPPHQNFSVQIPSNLPQGQAAITASHFSLIGAGPFPNLQVVNVTVNVV